MTSESQMKKLIFALPLALLLGFGAPVAANAAAEAPPTSALPASETANLEALLAASHTGDHTSFDAALASTLGASDASIVEYSTSFVAAGGTLADVTTAHASALTQDAATEGLAALAACEGTSGYTGLYWFGSQVALDSCGTSAFINGVGIAAAGGGVYAAASALTVAGLPAAAVVGVVAAVAALGVGFLNICRDASGTGSIYLNGGSPLAPPTCWGQ
ncbi:hypothetical protein [Cryobacterium sp. SO1]|uniref:hypothetical protein n=1 Tax=Cryobacterium sp. SO1 TaxID=1897061 RepID=UPI001023C3B2|nr:hypothetical protein [Cryobacterium sp. SO1]